MGIFSKHIGQGEKVTINGDEFTLKPLGIEYAGHFLKIGKGFSGAQKDGDLEGLFKNFNDETINSIKIVVMETLKQSYPSEHIEDLKQFGGKYMMQLLPVIVSLNQSNETDDKNRATKHIDKIRELNAKKDNGSSTPDNK